jgi:hypothetical protein
VVHPQFTEPESALQASGYAVTRLILWQDDGFALDPARVPEDAALVFIGNPTNPTSRLHPRASILGLVRPGRLVVVDEAFMDVALGEDDSILDDALLSAGLVVIRSLRSRGFALCRGDTFPGLGPQWLPIAAREPAVTDALLVALAQGVDCYQHDRAGLLGMSTKT